MLSVHPSRPRPWFRFEPMMLCGPGLLFSLSSFIFSDPKGNNSLLTVSSDKDLKYCIR